MKLFLHIGYSKTGTSAIQELLALSYDELLRQGILYPKAGRTEGQNKTAHFSLCFGLRSDTNGTVPNLWPERIQESIRSVVVSCEGFCHAKASDIPDIANFFKAFDVHVILYLRHPLNYLISSYAQALRTGKTSSSLEEFASSRRSTIRYSELLKHWETVGTLKVSVYDDKQRGLEADFLKTIDADIPNVPRKVVNPSPDGSVLFLLSFLNRFQRVVPSAVSRRTRNYILRNPRLFSWLPRRAVDLGAMKNVVKTETQSWDLELMRRYLSDHELNMLLR